MRSQLPLAIAAFPLASDEAAMVSRRVAYQHFIDAARAAQDMNCPDAAILSNEYALWLELRDPDTSDNARLRLENLLRDPTSAIRFIPFGLEFGIRLDLTVINEEIDRAIALNGGVTHDTAIARLALAFHQGSPKAVADYIDQHYEELSEYIDPAAIRHFEFEMLASAGLAERAHRLLDRLVAEGLSEIEQDRFRTRISQAEGADSLEIRRTQFHLTNSLGDLASLVGELERQQQWYDLCDYGRKLFQLTRDLKDAERLVVALFNTSRITEVIEFMEAHPHFLVQSIQLRLHYAWTLYFDGQLLESQAQLRQLTDATEDPNYRSLQVNMAITLGDWNSLLAYVDNEYRQRDKRNAHDLMDAAKLALHLGSPHAKDLIRLAAEAGHEDAAILVTAYGLASRGGWEGETQVVEWLAKAAELSSDEGPLHRISVTELLEQKPEWDRRSSDIWRRLTNGTIPMFVAAHSLNESLSDLMLFQALTNLQESDPRRRRAIPAYSGARRKVTTDITDAAVGMDPTALLTLSVLGILDEVLDAIGMVWVPHSTLAWLFEEKQRVAFHQVSRISDAHRIRHLVCN